MCLEARWWEILSVYATYKEDCALFICTLFNNAASNLDCTMLNDWMTGNNELEIYGRKLLWPSSRYFPGWTEETTKSPVSTVGFLTSI
jgi:hypothetical protein